MTSILENTTPALTKFYKTEEASVNGGGWVAMDPVGKTKFKMLAVDEEHNSYDALLWLASDSSFGSGRHSHGGETYGYILEGGYALTVFADHKDKEGTTSHYSKGDFIYQPAGQIHEEFLGDEDTLIYISNRNSKTKYEAFNETGSVVMTQSLDDMKQMLQT